MQNKLSDLNNHLFAEIERLGDEDLGGEELKAEISRAHAITGVASQIISNGNLLLRAHIAKSDEVKTLPKQLTD
ncbi:MAG: hypothetical protein LBN21_13030 [Treponema sp.]|jgi:hypothetical protein|nr:hypothetical protein [Treponema sp.]